MKSKESYAVAVRREFAARHFLIGGDWGAENELHEHHYAVEIRLKGRQLDRHGYLIDIDDVTFSQGLVQRMVGVGTIRIVSSDRSHPELFLYGIADVQEVAETLDDVRRKERRRRGLHIEAI